MSLNQTLVDAVQADNVVSLHNNREAIKASAQERDQNGRSLLHVAVASGAVDSALWLLDTGLANPNAADNQGETPLMRAAWLGQSEVVGALLKAGASLEARANTGGTALHYAHDGGTVAQGVVEQLLAAGANATAVDNSGREPSAWSAAAQARDEAAKLLVDGHVGGPPARSRLSLRR